ncbi:MAG: hypothetical protein KDA71_11845, partial [Planctomycetales bacterium]|nr:hypothetical protein [Planctomycetales bacterium]
MSRYSPSGNCCHQSCAVVESSVLATSAAWDTLAGSWNGGTLTGTAITKRSASGPQYLQSTVIAGEPGQVVDIMFGCDAAGVPDSYVRLTFGDSAVADACGTIQIVDGDTPLEDAQPVLGLVEGVSIRVTICCDAALGRWFVDVRPTNPFENLTPNGTASATSVSDATGRLGVRLFDTQDGSINITITSWLRMFTANETCAACHLCGTLIESTHPDGLVHGSTGVHTVGSLFYFGLNPVGVATVASHAIISDADRRQGYGLYAQGSAYLSASDATEVEVYADDYLA